MGVTPFTSNAPIARRSSGEAEAEEGVEPGEERDTKPRRWHRAWDHYLRIVALDLAISLSLRSKLLSSDERLIVPIRTPSQLLGTIHACWCCNSANPELTVLSRLRVREPAEPRGDAVGGHVLCELGVDDGAEAGEVCAVGRIGEDGVDDGL